MNKLFNIFVCFLLLSGCSNNLENTKNEKIEKLDNYEKSNILLDLHNKERKDRKLEEFLLDKNLCEYAQKHAEFMAEKDYLKHSKMKDLLNLSKSNFVGENIAFGQKTEKEVLDDWMKSLTHRMNITKKSFKKIGFGKAKNKNGEIYWCTVFSN